MVFEENLIQNINVEVPINRIFARMGYNRKLTTLPKEKEGEILRVIDEAVLYCDNKGLYKIFDFEFWDKGIVVEGEKIESLNIKKLLENSHKVVFMATTIGKDLVAERDRLFKEGDSFRGVIFDAVGSEMVEEVINVLQKMINDRLKIKGEKTTRRFSPGYGDLKLETQRIFFKLVDMSKLGVILSDSLIMYPEKSITAIAGIYMIKEE